MMIRRRYASGPYILLFLLFPPLGGVAASAFFLPQQVSTAGCAALASLLGLLAANYALGNQALQLPPRYEWFAAALGAYVALLGLAPFHDDFSHLFSFLGGAALVGDRFFIVHFVSYPAKSQVLYSCGGSAALWAGARFLASTKKMKEIDQSQPDVKRFFSVVLENHPITTLQFHRSSQSRRVLSASREAHALR